MNFIELLFNIREVLVKISLKNVAGKGRKKKRTELQRLICDYNEEVKKEIEAIEKIEKRRGAKTSMYWHYVTFFNIEFFLQIM